jgi:hypothetical protein
MEYQTGLTSTKPASVNPVASSRLDDGDIEPILIGLETLESVLARLQDAKIYAWVGTAPSLHIAAGLTVGSRDLHAEFHAVNGRWPHDMIATWLLETARRHFPDAGL